MTLANNAEQANHWQNASAAMIAASGKLIRGAPGTEEANLADLVKFGQGNRFSLVQLEDEIFRLSLRANYRSSQAPIPIFFCSGGMA
ncbi:MAG: hypothetical protein BGO99_00420 [Nitrosospira sp. 56-18]|jgi:hypothetical protein|nr:hypothetical protein [Nitrosospira sp.]OJY07765.1 MAG: hypothetical protein BGO99_00420 [Nitrosospira sp. 56-18]